MVEAITAGQWGAAREALRDSGDRFAELVRSVAPDAMATKDWTVADVLAHVTAIALWDTALVRTGEFPYPWNVLEDRIRITNVDTVAVLNDHTMERFPERDVGLLADRLLGHIDDVVRATVDVDPDLPIRWLGGSNVPVAGLFAHLTNELQIHGRDIARATGCRWVMPQEYSGQFMDLFVVGLARHGVGRLLDKSGPPNDRCVAVEFRSRYTAPVTLVLDRSRVSVGVRNGPADVRVRFEPVALNLMMFGRISRPRAAITGKVIVGGPRPWLLPTFLRTVRFPS
ncbi:maleylpyruvate isomerase family mycothiol-dependent enzyme [Nocardia arthritidis]|uniref:Maleylpyruvate isomerase family mycothiol-dependent enzyme n=1 Tax=Nocardia arthritidis TaxID=228602 RepID=A0A6G9YGZ8_9NOCA|nr:maleylpyruvate isomerase family mycothiol-dependent enzyme [Nocardia arthritidis]QIS12468.1 maleylpyruvate isomerase family mycothiol-dependent enzyme [Nocardia arthritidis]